MSTYPTAQEASQTPARPMGKLLETPSPPFPPPSTLEGRACTLTPLSTAHYPLLHKAVCLPPAPPGLWDYMLRGPFPEFAKFEDAMNDLLNNNQGSTQYFVICTAADGDGGAERIPMGMVSLIDIKPAHRSLEIGNVIYAPALQRTAAATEANLLLMRHAFALGYRRVVWKCNDLNEASKRAALRLGFEYEGVSKCHMVVRGRNRDTAWYAMVEDDWPVAERALVEWLKEGNFDGDGRQKEKLEDVRRRVAQ
ncbi:hypothetical protein V496_07950 [Pseudogymnoascus sp. VKM F-4515 (FW-2607)]|nr:hypothetical protein V496_07950 [Pseudogymnoascus sp. VKM F-4515 (FW-2607)]